MRSEILGNLPQTYSDTDRYAEDYNKDGLEGEDFERLLQALSEVKGKFLLSSYPGELLQRYTTQHGWRTIAIDMVKSSGAGIGSTSHTKTEVLTLNYDSDNISQQGRLF